MKTKEENWGALIQYLELGCTKETRLPLIKMACAYGLDKGMFRHQRTRLHAARVINNPSGKLNQATLSSLLEFSSTDVLSLHNTRLIQEY